MKIYRDSFRDSLEISIILHVAVAGLVVLAVNYRPVVIHLKAAPSAFAHAIAISLMPQRHPQPKPVEKPTPKVTPKPQPRTIETQATQAVEQTPPPEAKPTPPTMPSHDQPEQESPPDYQTVAEAILAANKRYPREALLAGTEGSVTFSYIVNSQGTVLAFTIEQSSGSEVLDDEVKRLIHSVRFPPFPKGDTDTRKNLEVTIEFKLH